MQLFVKCPLCGLIYDAYAVPSVMLEIDGIRRTAHRTCADRLAMPPSTVKPNGEVKPNGPLNLKPGVSLENA